MGAWDFKKPQDGTSECAKSIWKMVCNTYFPKAQAGCGAGQVTPYQRPCSNVCQNYVNACDIRCCDESTKCVFERDVGTEKGVSVMEIGYHEAEGPCAECTGFAARGASLNILTGLFLATLLR